MADNLAKTTRILCWIMTYGANLDTKVADIKNTWGKRCNVLLIASDTEDKEHDTIPINVTKGRQHLTMKTMKTFDYIYQHHMDDADWFMKADDDTYVIVENLRYFLSQEDTNKPVYFGKRFRSFNGYNSGGAGYVLSKEALRRFGARKSDVCKDDLGPEDVNMGKCMKILEVELGDSRDALNRSRFHCFNPGSHITSSYPEWYLKYDQEEGEGVSYLPIFNITNIHQKTYIKCCSVTSKIEDAFAWYVHYFSKHLIVLL